MLCSSSANSEACYSFDFIFNLASVFLKYLQPFFIKYACHSYNFIFWSLPCYRRIIDSFSLEVSEERNRAFAYACLMFVAQVIQSETDVQHSWRSRRAEAQLRTVLMAAIYDKALKRNDISGRVSKRGNETNNDDTGADVGKIVNLMSGDANRVSDPLLSSVADLMASPTGCPDCLGDVFHLRMSNWYANFASS